MALHHALKTLAPEPRAALSTFILMAIDLLLEQDAALEKAVNTLRPKNWTGKTRDDYLDLCQRMGESLEDILPLSHTNEKALENYAGDFVLPESGDREAFVRSVKGLLEWLENPNLDRRLGRDRRLFESLVYETVATVGEIEPEALATLTEDDIREFNYVLLVLVLAKDIEATGKRTMLDAMDGTRHPLDLAFIPSLNHDFERFQRAAATLTDDERRYLQTLFVCLREALARAGFSRDAFPQMLAERYGEAFAKEITNALAIVERALHTEALEDDGDTLYQRLSESIPFCETILSLRAKLMFAEQTRWVSVLAAPLKLTALVSSELIDDFKETCVFELLQPLMMTDVDENDLIGLYDKEGVFNNALEEALSSVPPTLLAPVYLSIAILLEGALRILDDEERERIERATGVSLCEMNPFLADPLYREAVSMALELLADATERFGARHRELFPGIDDGQARKRMILSMPEAFDMMLTTVGGDNEEEILAAYRAILLIWVLALDCEPVFRAVVQASAETDEPEVFDLLMKTLDPLVDRLTPVVTAAELHEGAAGSDEEWEEMSEAPRKKGKKKGSGKVAKRVVTLIDDSVPEGTLFN